MGRITTKMTPKKVFISVTSLVLVFALLFTALCTTAPNRGLKVSAASTFLTSVSGNNVIPDEYEGVNVPAGTYLMSEEEYAKGANAKPYTSADGVAVFDFHIFAENFAAGIHTCGNIAVEHLGGEVLGKTSVPEFGSRTEHSTLSEKLSYVGDTVSWSQATNLNNMTMVFGDGNTVSGEGQITLNSLGQNIMLGNGNKMLDNIYIDDESDGTPFIDITEELAEAEDYQRYLVWLQEQIVDNSSYVSGWGYATTVNGETARVLTYQDLSRYAGWGSFNFDFSKFKEETIIIDFDPYYSAGGWWSWPGWYTNANSLISGNVTFKGTAGKRIIMNVDTTHLPNDSVTFENITMKVDGINNSESSVEKDNNVLWNFYQKNASDGIVRSTTGQINIGGTWVGTVLAPDATINANAGLNGSMIAENITSGCETHKSDYTGEKINQSENGKTSLTLTKIWDDNPNLRPQFISVKLLRNGKVHKTVQLTEEMVRGSTADGDGVSADGNTWTYTFENLELKEPNGKYFRYTVEEIVPAGYTNSVFNNTIINTSEATEEIPEPEYGSITVKKKAKGSPDSLLGGAWFKLTSNSGANLSGATAQDGTTQSFTATDNEVTWCSVEGVAAVIENLPVGDYTLHETGAPAGYKAAASKPVKVEKDNNKEVPFENEQIKVKFAKVTRDENGNITGMLTGATLKLTSAYGADMSKLTVTGATIVSQDSTQLTIKTTGKEFHIAGFAEGYYTLTELEAPVGYQIAAPITVYINNSGEAYDANWQHLARVEMTDEEMPEEEPEPVTHTININKTDGATAIPDAVLELTSVTGADLTNVTVNNGNNVTNDGKVIRWTSNGWGATTFNNLPEGYYTLTEVTAPAGYKKAAQMTLDVKDGSTDFTMTDSVITMSVSKKDKNSGVEISGAHLKLTASGVNLSGVTAENADEFNASADAVTWKSTGTPALFSKLPAGNYTLSEVTPPAGYKPAADINFTVDEFGNVYGNGINGTTATMYDEPTVIEIAKRYYDKIAETYTDNLSGATLRMSGVDADGNKINLNNVTGTISVEHTTDYTITWQTGNTPNTLRGLPDGTYNLREVTAPDGFDVCYNVTVVIEDGEITYCEDVAPSSGTLNAKLESVQDGNKITLTDGKQSFYSLRFSKVDFESAVTSGSDIEYVKGATLGIFKADAQAFTADHAVMVFESTEEEMTMMLSDGEYVICELAAPDASDNKDAEGKDVAYDRSTEKVFFTVNNGTLKITKINNYEKATAGHGNPSDSGLALDKDCYFTLETTSIFEQYGEFPSEVSFNLPGGYSCTSFILYEDVKQEDGTVKAVPVVTHNGIPETKWHYNVATTAAVNGYTYNNGSTYYAVVTIVDANGNEVTTDELESINFDFEYDEIKLDAEAYYGEVYPGHVGKYGNYHDIAGDIEGGVLVLDHGNKYGILPDRITIEFSDIDGVDENGNTVPDVMLTGYEVHVTLKNPSWKAAYTWKVEANSINQVIKNGDVLTLYATDEFRTQNEIVEGDAYVIDGHMYFSNNEPITYTITAHYNSDADGSSGSGSGGSSGEAGGGSSGGTTVTDTDLTIGEYEETFFVQSEGGETAKIMFPNEKTPKEETNQCAVKLNKVDQNGNNIINSGTASFLLYDGDNNLVTNLEKKSDGVYEYKETVTNPANTAENPLLTNAADGTLVINGLNTGSYSFQEIEAPNNYLLSEDMVSVKLNLTDLIDDPKEIYVKNTLKQGTFLINKTDDFGNPVEGAQFKLYKVNPANIWSTNPDGEVVKNEKGEEMIFTTDHTGKVTATGLDLGNLYYAVEVGAPSGTENSNENVKLPQLETTGISASRYVINGQNIGFGIFLGELGSYGKAQVLGYDLTQPEEGQNPDWVDSASVITDGSISAENKAYRTTFIKNDITDSQNVKPQAGAVLKLTYSGVNETAKLNDVSAYIIKTVDGAETSTPVALTYYYGKNADGAYEEYLMWTTTEDAEGVTLVGLPTDLSYTLTEAEVPYGFEPVAKSYAVTAGNNFDNTVDYTVENKQLFGKITLTKVDSLTGAALEGIQFELQTSTDGETWTKYGDATYTTDANGKITVENLPYGASYRFKETKALDGYKFTEEIYSDEVTFVGSSADMTKNVFASNTPDTGSITLTKTVEGGSAPVEGAKYQLYYSKDGNDFTLFSNTEYTTDAEGKITVDELPWGYTYKFKETSTPAGYVKCEDYTDTATLTAKNLNGTIAHTNAPLAGSVELTAVKTISGRDMKDTDVFEFELKKDGTVLQTVSNNGSEIKFNKINYTYADVGTHTYTISEKAYNSNGITNDSTVHTVTVTVAVSADGKTLTATPDKSGAAVTFTNTYGVDETSIVISGTKTLTGRDLKDGEFTFKLVGDGKELTATNKDGKFAFDAIKYTAAGTYTYTVSEVKGTLGGVEYDENTYTVNVTVKDNGDGTLTATADKNGADIAFNNTYGVDETSIVISGTKTLEGRELKDGEFTFKLVGDGKELTATNKDGKFAFDEIKYTAAGTYTYTVSEVKGTLGGVDYDETTYTVTVTVKDNGDGTLTATADKNGADIAFTNTYGVTETSIVISGTKTLEGRELKDGEFTFKLVGDGKELTATNKDGKFAFDEIKYTAAGTYTYTVSEVKGNLGGVDYDETTYTVNVTVKDNGDGTLTATADKNGADIAFTNTYGVDETSIVISGTKTLTGRDLKDDEFTFKLVGDGKELTATNKDGKFAFDAIKYTAAGTYTYTVSEVKGNLGGVEYDENTYTVTVTVKDNGDGTLTATADKNGADIAFNNTYGVDETSIVISGTKTLTGRDLKDGEFTFKLVGDGKELTATNKDGKFAFDEIKYTAAGTYTYTVSEVKGTLGGVDYDETTYTVTVTVKDNGDGTLTATADKNGADIAFTNTYSVQKTSIVIGGVKKFNKQLAGDEFTFVLTDANGTEYTAKNNAAGGFTFDAIEYTAAGTYTYTVREAAGNLGGVSYDGTTYNVTVTVKDNGDGTLTATADKNGTAIVFTNTYSVGSVEATIGGTKVLTGRDLKDDEFTFKLTGNGTDLTATNKGGSFTFDAIKYTAAGTYTYTVSEVKGNLGGVEYDENTYTVTVNVTDNGDGTLSASVDKKASEVVFTNKYTTQKTSITIGGTKTLEGRDLKDGEFTFKLTGSGTELTATNKDGKFEFDAIEYTAAGTYTYTISEVKGILGGVDYDETTYTVTVTVKDNGDGTLTATADKSVSDIAFTNTYGVTETSIVISGIKTLEGRTLKDGEFTFKLVGDGKELTATNKDGKFAFDEIKYTAAGTYTYTVSEVKGSLGGVEYDENTYTVTVTVKDNGDGTLTATADKNGADIAFTNTYSVGKTSVTIGGTKTLEGRTLKDDEFTFKLTGNGTELTATNKGGSFTFDAIEYTTAGTYTYTVSEVKGNLGGVDYDETTYTVNVTVKDNGDGTLTATADKNGADIAFTNTYGVNGTSIVINGTKTLEGRDLSDGEFTFVLSGTDLDEALTATNKDGKFEFDAIEYTAAGTYTYTVSEVKGNLGGVSYDETVYTVTVTVKDNGDGTLTATADKNGTDLAFENSYSVQKTTVALNGVKEYNKPLNGNDFTFVLKNNVTGTEYTAKNSEAGTFVFNGLEFSEKGNYYYTFTEKNDGKGGVEYDDSTINVAILVTDKGDGTLSAKIVTTRDGAATDVVFTNTYSVDETTITIGGTKTLEGRDLKDGEFTFVLSGTDLDEALTATNKDGKFAFDAITYTAAGTYTYTVSEVEGTLGGVEYDDTVYTVTVTVTDNGDGTLTATADKSVSDIAFNNTYDVVSTTYTVSGTKVLSGSDLEAGQFDFILTGTGIDEALTATNNADGTFAFDAITYTETGTYEYTVTEVVPDGDKAGITYDTRKYEITVRVTDNGDGTLTAAGPENITEKLKFTNVYTAQPTKISVNGVKTLIGRPLTANEFTFTLTGEGENQSVNNTENGTFAFTDISFDKAGTYTYTIKETAGTAKDIWYDNTEYVMTVTVIDNGHGELEATKSIVKKGEEGEAGVRFTNKVTAADLTLSKKALTGSDELAGAKLILKPTEGQNIAAAVIPNGAEIKDGAITWTSGDKALTIGLVPAGVYEFTEITAPDGYEVAETIYVKVSGSDIYHGSSADTTSWNKAADGTVVMKDAPNSLTLSKKELTGVDELADAQLILKPVTETDLDNVVLPDGAEVKDGAITWTSGDEALTIGRVPAGVYEFTEITAPDGYEVAETIYVKVSGSDIYRADSAKPESWTKEATETVVMKDAPNGLTLSKQEVGGGDELPGAQLILKPVVETDLNKVKLPEGAEVKDGAITWTSGDEALTIGRVPEGVYEFTEITAPSGYEVAETIYVKVSGSDIYSADKAEPESWTKVTTETVIMEDAHNTLVLSKVEFGGGDELVNALLTLEATSSDTDLTTVEVSRTDVAKTKDSISWVSKEDALDLHKVPDGVYKFTEVIEPDGYEKAEFIYVKVENGKVYYAKYDEATKAYGEWKLATDDTVVMEDKPATLVISKMAVGGGSELAGAKLTLESVSSTANLNNVRIPETVSRTDGGISWTSGGSAVEIELIPEGVYKFTETTAPDGYQVAETIYVKVSGSDIFSVKESDYKEDGTTDWGTAVKDDTVIMYDAPVVIPKTANISFTKYSDINKVLPGAVFALKSADGTSKTATSGADGVVLFTAVPEGVYTLTEVSSPANYEKSTNIITVAVDSEGVASFKGPNGNAIDILGIENLMRNKIIPVEDEKKVTVGDIVDLYEELVKELGDLKGENITWESTDTNIATVDKNGNVTIKTPGKVTINAYKDGVIVGSFVLGASDKETPAPPVTNGNNTPNTGESDTPSTGDDNNNIIAINIGLVSLVVAAITGKAIYNRRKRRTN